MRAGLLALVLLSAPAFAAPAPPSPDCRTGGYRLADGAILDVGPSQGGMRWRRSDGLTGALVPTRKDGVFASTLGWTGKPDAHALSFDCARGEVRFDGQAATRILFDVKQTIFLDGDARLAGRLVLPKGADAIPIAILVTGSEETSAVDSNPLQRLLPAMGIGVFVYDKRGTGRSTGAYTQDFEVLSRGALSALAEARSLAGKRAGRVGFVGLSLGGWVAPIAAARSKVDFVVVGYGLAVSPLEQNRSELVLEMQLAGDSRADIDKALEIADAADAIMLSAFTHGFERFDAVRAKYRAEPWYKNVHGNFLWLMLPLSEAELRAAKDQFLVGTPWRRDPMPMLLTAKTPQLWILGNDDLKAPSAETSRRITRLAQQGKPFTLALVPGADHGLYEYETAKDGTRARTRLSSVYLPMLRDFIREGRLRASYGDALIVSPSSASAPR
jgi:dienelactone hydrolase